MDFLISVQDNRTVEQRSARQTHPISAKKKKAPLFFVFRKDKSHNSLLSIFSKETIQTKNETMRQLIHSFEKSHVILALNNQAYVIDEHECFLLETSNAAASIQAVAITQDNYNSNNIMIYAIARSDKSLQIFRGKELVVSYVTPKRVSSLYFTKVQNDLTVVVMGDLAGDAIAYPIDKNDENKSIGRLLLGHTASMLTKVMVHNEWILTADRDEKIRISQFPETHRIHGYLLGHLAFVSSFDAHEDTCVSCGGDGTIRVWKISTSTELTSTAVADNEDSQRPIPSSILWDGSGQFVAVICDGSRHVDFFSWQEGTGLSRCARIECQAQPLGLARLGSSTFLILIRDAPFLQEFHLDASKNLLVTEETSSVFRSKLEEITRDREITDIPESLLERDHHGNVKIDKHNETRGPTHSKPWEDVSRVEVARERNRRGKRRKRESMNDEEQD